MAHSSLRRQLMLTRSDVQTFNAQLSTPNGNALCFLPDDPGCVLWEGRVNERGYGLVKLDRHRHTVPAHHVAWAIKHGHIPADTNLVVDHLCQVPSCVSVLHLEWVTALENSRRIDGRNHVCRRGHPWRGLLPLYRLGSQLRLCFRCIEEGPRRRLPEPRRKGKVKADRMLWCPRGHDVSGSNGYDLENLPDRRGCWKCTHHWKRSLNKTWRHPVRRLGLQGVLLHLPFLP